MIKTKYSLVMKIIIGSTIVVVILFTALVLNYFYSIHVVRNNIIISKSNALDIYINNMENILNNAVNDLNYVVMNIDDFSALINHDESIRYFSSIKILDSLSNRINGNNYSDALIVFNRKTDLFIASYDPKIKPGEKDDMMQLVKRDMLGTENNKKAWSIAHLDEKVYIYKVYCIASTKIISFIIPTSLMALIDNTTTETERFLLTDNKGNIISELGDNKNILSGDSIPNDMPSISDYKNKFLLITRQLDQINARLSVMVREKNVLLAFNSLQWFIIVLGFISFIITPFFIYFLNKEIIQPINRLTSGIKKIEQGDLEHQVKQENISKEFNILTKTFNKMVREIKNLKINYYEEQIELQKAEIRYLQIQLRPHFYLNALTTIHSLSYKKDVEISRKYITALSKHLRYILKGAMTQVTLKEEIKHVKNYIAMQEIRFPGSVFYMVDAEQELYHVKIPLMLILTFVENAFKHAMTLDETLSILIKVVKCQIDSEEFMKIIVEDSGEGFSQEIIDSVNNNLNLFLEGNKIGILNIKKTLQLLYERENLLKLGNTDFRGARIEIFIPLGV